MSAWMIVIERCYYCKWHADVTEPFVAQYVLCSLSSHSLWPAASTGSSCMVVFAYHAAVRIASLSHDP